MGAFSAWRSHSLVDGEVLVPPEGARHAAIRVRSRLRPLAPLADVCERSLARFAAIVEDIRSEPAERLLTVEGEHAVAVAASGTRTRDGAVVDFFNAIVVGDDFYEHIDAYSTDHRQQESFRASLRGFVCEHRMWLGATRARWFDYQPPRDWNGRARGLHAEWFAPAYPRHPARIRVAPALPCHEPFSAIEPVVLARLEMRDIVPVARGPARRIDSDHGLNGILWPMSARAATTPHARELVVAALLDDRFLYLLQLETVAQHADADRARFLEVVRSARPVPPRPALGQSNALLTALLRRAAS